jgi:hypothetical protein
MTPRPVVLLRAPTRGVGAAIRSTAHRSAVAGFQKRNRSPTVGAMLLRRRKKANPHSLAS